MRWVLWFSMFGWLGVAATAEAGLSAPSGFYNPGLQLRVSTKAVTCPQFAVYRGSLTFPSKYEGSGPARDTVNPESQREFERLTKPMSDLQQQSASLSDRLFKGKGTSQDLQCLLSLWRGWAQEHALEEETPSPVGRAVRKWTLGAIAANYLKVQLNFAAQIPADDRQSIERWITALATQVQKDYSNRSLKQTNNHDYWAAWGVMASAIVLQRQDLFDWSYGIYQTAMEQVSAEGFLPNELRRKTRAASYHNFALQPLVVLAAFAQANQQQPLVLQQHALDRLVNSVLTSMDNPALIEQAAGARQVQEDLRTGGRLSWMASYVSISHNDSSLTLIKQLMPLRTSRLGGDQSFIYLRDRPEIYPDRREIK
jgi:poly(beta-D-mannuronate) lyase